MSPPEDRTGEERFLARIRAALGQPEHAGPERAGRVFAAPAQSVGPTLRHLRKRSTPERMLLLETLVAAAEPIHLQCRPVSSFQEAAVAIGAIAREREPEWSATRRVVAWRHPLIDSLDLDGVLAREGIPVIRCDASDSEEGRRRFRDAAAGASIGITAADWAVAESATLVLRTRPGQGRSVSLLPSLHIAVIRLDRIVASFSELYALLCHDPEERELGLGTCTTFISGPSKTADIEACMVQGAHGPREMMVFVLTGEG